MTGFEQAIFWAVVFAIVFPIYHYIKWKINKSSIGKPTDEEQDASGNTL